jgi:hypothetical protein
MTDFKNLMQLTPKQQFLAFVLARGEQFYTVMTNPSSKESDVELAISCLIAFVPDAYTRSELYKFYFTNKKELNVRTAAVLTCGQTISALAGSMDIADTASGGFI